MQPIYRTNPFVTVEGNGRGRTNAYIKGSGIDVGADIFRRGLCLPSDNKMTEEQQDRIIEIIHVQAVFEEYTIGLSMGIIESARGKGYGKLIIAKAVDYYKDCKTFFCFIREDNRASIGSFKANGFIEVDGAYKQYFPLDGKEFVMQRFELHR